MAIKYLSENMFDEEKDLYMRATKAIVQNKVNREIEKPTNRTILNRTETKTIGLVQFFSEKPETIIITKTEWQKTETNLNQN